MPKKLKPIEDVIENPVAPVHTEPSGNPPSKRIDAKPPSEPPLKAKR